MLHDHAMFVLAAWTYKPKCSEYNGLFTCTVRLTLVSLISAFHDAMYSPLVPI